MSFVRADAFSWHSHGFGNRSLALFIFHYNAAPLVSGQLPTCVGMLVAIVEAIGLCFQQPCPQVSVVPSQMHELQGKIGHPSDRH